MLTLTSCQTSQRVLLGDQFPLVVEEHRIVSAAEDTPDHCEYRKRIGDTILGKRKTWRAVDMNRDSVRCVNERTGPLGYRLILNAAAHPRYGQPIYDLVRSADDPQARVPSLQNVHSFRMNERKTSFLFLASQLRQDRTPCVLVRDGKAVDWDVTRYASLSPILHGDSLMAIEKTRIGDGKTLHSTLYLFRVLKDGEKVFVFRAEEGPVLEVLKRFFSWKGSWVVEYENHVVVDGNYVGQGRGYDAVFCYRIIGGEPFYFFVRDGKTHMAYRGRPLPHTYEEVVHYKGCEPALFNVGNSENMVWFHARRDGQWYYVEAGVYGHRKMKDAEQGAGPDG